MIEQPYKDVYDEELAKDAIINDRHTGHKEDYLLLHVLLKKYKPNTFMEIGTNTGFGTMIIKNALGHNSFVFSLDLPDDESYKSKQHPLSEGKNGVGYECTLPYFQLKGDSLRFDYSDYPCEGFFIDSEHCFENVFIETIRIVRLNPKIIIWHDADEPEVFDAAKKAMKDKPYELYRITDSRIAYALIKDICHLMKLA